MSLAQSAQTKDDWNLVFAQWKRAIKLLQAAPQQTPTIKQRIAEYNRGLLQATREAKISLNPRLAPVDPTGNQAIKTLIGIQGGDSETDPKAATKGAAKAGTQPPAATAAPNPAPAAGQAVDPATPTATIPIAPPPSP
jgi:hypothetical protein